MIYSAIVIEAGEDAGTWVVSPAYTRVDGQPAPNILALSANGIVPEVDDIVLCAEGINPFDHSSVRSFDNNHGSNPIIIATLGEGLYKMVLGDLLQTWAQSVDTAITSLYTWAKTGVAPGPAGGIAPFVVTPANPEPAWETTNLSEKHKLD